MSIGDRTDCVSLCCWLKVSRHERRPSQLEALNDRPLYPTEDIIWDENVVPMEYFATESKCHIR